MYASDEDYCEGCLAAVDQQHLLECSVWRELRATNRVAGAASQNNPAV